LAIFCFSTWDEIPLTTFSLLSKLRDSQLTDPPNAYFGKRFFCSLKEVSKVVYRGCQAIIVAPDIKPSTTANIKPVRLLHSILQAATDSGVPVIFALSRRGIGRVFGRDKSMSIVAVMMIDGVEREFADMLLYAAEGRKEYRRCFLNNNGY
jgi:ribosomal protein L7Ae-like RNA K-turn-binding protein